MQNAGPLTRAALAILLLSNVPAGGTEVRVTITGEVEFNGISAGTLGGVAAGESAVVRFSLDSDVFMDSGSFATRGYPIVPGSFELVFDSVAIGLQNPFPAGETPYFVLRNDDPGVDGFIVSTSVDFPAGVPINQAGVFGQFRNNFYVTYGVTTLDSFDLLAAAGTYDFSGLSVFNWTIDDGPFSPMGLMFATLAIEAVTSAPVLRRADSNGDGSFDISDAIFTLVALFSGGAPLPACADAGDSNDDGQYNLADAIYTLAALFTPGSPPPPAPGPTTCGADPTADALGCASYPAACL